MLDNITSHYRKEDREFIKEASNFISACSKKDILKATDFLDPNKQKFFNDICNRYDNIKCEFNGGFDESERKRALIVPRNCSYEPVDFRIKVIRVIVNDNSAKLKHGDFLGAILGQGIKRDKVGDLFIDNNICYIALDEGLADYIYNNLFQVNKYNVTVEYLQENNEFLNIKNNLKIMTNTVSSLRLDCILKISYNLSRSQAADFIKKGQVKHNWSVCEVPSQPINVGDIVSLKGKGKIKVMNISTPNKKGRFQVEIGKYH
jgi:RNA-binding protein YlmH